LHSIKPFLSESEFEHSEAVAKDFVAGVGMRLQAQLEERASEEKNWLEEWWEGFAYLRSRAPIAVNINWHGVTPGEVMFGQAEGAAIFTQYILRFRQALLDETMEPETLAGNPLCMNQYSRMFNTCRVPHEGMDELYRFEHSRSKHVVVLRNNAIYALDVLDRDGAILPLGDIWEGFDWILRDSSAMFELTKHPAVSVLTSENRDTWAAEREHLIGVDPKNAASVDAIEHALFAVSLRSEMPRNTEEVANEALIGDGRNTWFDKPFNLVVFANGRGGVNGEHTWADAMVVVKLFDVVLKQLDASIRESGKPPRTAPSAGWKNPRRLEFVMDERATRAIEVASSHVGRLIASVDLKVLEFAHYGKEFMKWYRVIPDFYTQMAIQLAYFKLHGRVVSTYESAHTRLFYHGRTETIRTCSVDSKTFVEAMCDSTETDERRYELLKTAIDAHKAYAKDCIMGQGVDRHLLGLYVVSEMEGIRPRPALFTDKGFVESSKWTLSTSNVSLSASPMFGGFYTAAEDGYGVCYSIQGDMVKFSICSNATCKDTSATAFKAALEQAMTDMQRVCMSRDVLYAGEPAKL
jgi:hypothetical protein